MFSYKKMAPQRLSLLSLLFSSLCMPCWLEKRRAYEVNSSPHAKLDVIEVGFGGAPWCSLVFFCCTLIQLHRRVHAHIIVSSHLCARMKCMRERFILKAPRLFFHMAAQGKELKMNFFRHSSLFSATHLRWSTSGEKDSDNFSSFLPLRPGGYLG